MKIVPANIYIADDGREFAIREECEAHDIRVHLEKLIADADLERYNEDAGFNIITKADLMAFLVKYHCEIAEAVNPDIFEV